VVRLINRRVAHASAFFDAICSNGQGYNAWRLPSNQSCKHPSLGKGQQIRFNSKPWELKVLLDGQALNTDPVLKPAVPGRALTMNLLQRVMARGAPLINSSNVLACVFQCMEGPGSLKGAVYESEHLLLLHGTHGKP